MSISGESGAAKLFSVASHVWVFAVLGECASELTFALAPIASKVLEIVPSLLTAAACETAAMVAAIAGTISFASKSMSMEALRFYSIPFDS